MEWCWSQSLLWSHGLDRLMTSHSLIAPSSWYDFPDLQAVLVVHSCLWTAKSQSASDLKVELVWWLWSVYLLLDLVVDGPRWSSCTKFRTFNPSRPCSSNWGNVSADRWSDFLQVYSSSSWCETWFLLPHRQHASLTPRLQASWSTFPESY